MKLVMTLLARDEADIVDAQLAFHLNAGVDFVIATDHASRDGTTEIFERYAREGWLHLVREEGGDYLETEWRTRMARLAATEFAADWVFASDADEFWWPRGGDLQQVLETIPARYGIVRAFWRPFVPRPDDGSFFGERMTVRLSATAPINDPLSQWRPNAKVLHRARADVVVGRGNHSVESDLVPLRGWYPVEVLHFPLRSRGQFERKASVWTATDTVRFHDAHRAAHVAVESGRSAETYDALVVDDEELRRGLDEGSLVVDERLRDALRDLVGGGQVSPLRPEQAEQLALPVGGRGRLRLPLPTVVEDAAYAVDVAVLGEADVVRARRRIDELERRVSSLERRPSARFAHLVRRVFRRSRRR